MFKKLICAMVLFSPVYSFATWDITTPSGSEAKSMGDDRIREFKTDIQTSLQFSGSFPGSDTGDPRYIPTISSGTTLLRPTGNDAAAGMFYINVTSGCVEYFNGANWSCAPTVPASGINSTQISTTVAGIDLVGGGGSPLDVNSDTNSFVVGGDTLTIKVGGITGAQLLDGTITGSDVTISTFIVPGSIKASAQPSFSAYSSSDQDDVTGDASDATVVFGTEEYDTTNNFITSTFTATIAGRYLFNTCIEWEDGGATADFFLSLVTTNRTYTAVDDNQDFGSKCINKIVNMAIGDKASVHFLVSNGSKVVDILGGTVHGLSAPSGVKVTFFDGQLLP